MKFCNFLYLNKVNESVSCNVSQFFFLNVSLFSMFRDFFFHISFFNIRMPKVSSKKQKEPSNEPLKKNESLLLLHKKKRFV